MKSHEEKPLVIIGAGIAGVAAALELAEKYPTQKITIIDQSTLFSGSTGRNPARMGHGFHYMDLETSIKYLRASIEVQKRYPDFLIGFGQTSGRGRYYIHKQSKHPASQILELYHAIQAEYQRMCQEDPSNQVFGDPKEFIRVLDEKEYFNNINTNLVELGIETAEHLFNFPKFAAYIREIIEANPNIHLVENVEVTNIQHWMDTDSRFSIEMKSTVSGDALASLSSDVIVNSSWENIEFLNSKIGVPYQVGTRTNRLKCLVEVELPAHLTNVNSSFFCMGPFCMFSNMGDGRGMLTLADVTNSAVNSALKIDQKMEDCLTGKISAEEMSDFSKKILDGVAYYIPGMVDAKILKLHFGIVQTEGDLKLQDVHSSASGMHQRRETGVREEIQGLTSNPGRKLFYFPYNGIEVSKIVQTQFEREVKIKELLVGFIKTTSAENINELRIFLDRWIVGIVDISTIENDLLLVKFKDALQSHASLSHLVISVMKNTLAAFTADELTTSVIKFPGTATSTGALPERQIGPADLKNSLILKMSETGSNDGRQVGADGKKQARTMQTTDYTGNKSGASKEYLLNSENKGILETADREIQSLLTETNIIPELLEPRACTAPPCSNGAHGNETDIRPHSAGSVRNLTFFNCPKKAQASLGVSPKV